MDILKEKRKELDELYNSIVIENTKDDRTDGDVSKTWEFIKQIRKPKELIGMLEKMQSDWINYCTKLEDLSKKEYEQKVKDLEDDIKEHPDFQVMEKRLNALEVLYKESERQKAAALKKNKEQERELRILRNQKKAGRPALEPWIIDRIEELRGQGMSVRKIQKALEAEGISVSVPVVGKYVAVYNKNIQIEGNISDTEVL